MNHYIKIDNVEFENHELGFRLYFQPFVEGQDYYSQIHFDKIYIDTDSTFECKTNWSPNASKYTIGIQGLTDPYDFEEHTEVIDGITYRYVDVRISYAYDKDTPNEYKAFSLGSTSENIYFIYVTVKGDYTETAPLIIQAQPKQNEFYIYHEVKLYDKIFEVVQNSLCIERCDSINLDSVNLVVFFNGFLSAMKTGQIVDGIKFWKLLHKNKEHLNKKCSCNG